MDRLRRIPLRTITVEAFAPFGEVLGAPSIGERVDASPYLSNLRIDAKVRLAVASRASASLPHRNKIMERHRWSAQIFIPIDVSRYIVAVAPHAPAGGPDLAGLQGFSVDGRQSIVYRPNVWHCPMTVLDRDARYAVFLWKDGTDGDEEFFELAECLEFFEGP